MDNKAVIDNKNYTFYTMPPTEAFPLLLNFLGTFGKSLVPLVAQQERPTNAMIASLIDAFSQGDANKILQLFRTVFKYVRHNDEVIDMDDTFRGRNKHLLKVILYALAFNYHDFLGESLLAFAIKTLTV